MAEKSRDCFKLRLATYLLLSATCHTSPPSAYHPEHIFPHLEIFKLHHLRNLQVTIINTLTLAMKKEKKKRILLNLSPATLQQTTCVIIVGQHSKQNNLGFFNRKLCNFDINESLKCILL